VSYSVHFSEIPPNSGVQFIDVRSPVEFVQGHIPGAVNIPLFADEERAEIGTMYKQVDKEQALQLGEKIARPKVDGILAQIKSFLPAKIVIYCWRGGKRSTEVCRLVNESGTPARRIQGGYKDYRRRIRNFIEQPRKLLMVGGKTGSGKTDLLLGLKKQNLQIIDLEGLAHHKGSVFGHINEEAQPSTEQFENNFVEELRLTNPEELLLLENESYIIGSVHLPPPLLVQMRAAPLLIIEIPLQARIDRLVREYTSTDRQQLIEACQRIAKKLTHPKLQAVTTFIEQDDFSSACEILLGYYDHYYNRGLDNRKNQEIFYLTLNGFDLDADVGAVAQMVTKQFGSTIVEVEF
jgi:tRNA 2-selenouridine synthase